jgi:site-specific recombinase XerD
METRQDVRTDVPATLDELIAAARQSMEEAGYTPSTRSRYGEVWSAVKRFALTVEKTDHFSVDLIERYLTHRGYPPGGWPHPMPPRLQQDLSALRLLTEFQVRGRIQPKQCVDRRLSLPAHLLQALTDYEQECICAGNRPATLRTRRQYLLAFLVFLHRAGVEHLSSVRPAQLSDFLLAQHQHCPGAVAPIITALRSFLRHLQRRGILGDDVAATLPKFPGYKLAKIPSVWSAEEVEKLLAQVDRGSPQGKRDYAILLLAAHLGMRVGDIVRLRLEHLCWEEKRIELTQSKTGRPLVLPLTEEVGWALIDYLRHRPSSVPHREVFLWCHPPFRPFAHGNNLQCLITKYRRQAGIAVPPRRPGGLHVLRHSLATRLLKAGTPLTTIGDILGHASSESTRIYTKVDLPQLQICPLDPEEVHHA